MQTDSYRSIGRHAVELADPESQNSIDQIHGQSKT